MRALSRLLLILVLASSLGFAWTGNSCENITASGAYQLNSNVAGAPNLVPSSPYYACILITASDVTLDCKGHTITGSGASNTYGIFINYPVARVKVKNCPGISDYAAGVVSYQSDYDTFDNITSFSNLDAGFWIFDSAYNNVSNSLAYDNPGDGFSLDSYSNHDRLVNNVAYNSQRGFNLWSATNSTVINNTAYNIGDWGFVAVADDNTFINNTAHDCNYGFDVDGNHETLVGNVVHHNGNTGIFVGDGSGNRVMGNTAHDNLFYDVLVVNSASLVLANNNVSNSWVGFMVEGVWDSNITNNSMRNGGAGFLLTPDGLGDLTENSIFDRNTVNNVSWGFEIDNSPGNNFTNNIINGFAAAFDVTAGSNYNRFINNSANGGNAYGFWLFDGYNTFINNSANGNSWYGFYLSSSPGNNFTNNTADNNSYYGFYLTNSTGNSIIHNTAQDNGAYDIFVGDQYAGIGDGTDCDNLIANNTGSGGRLIYYANQTVAWSGLDASEVFLCDAGGSVITGSSAHGSDSLFNDGFFLMNTSGAGISGSSSSNNYYGFYLLGSDNNAFLNDSASGNSIYGFYLSSSSGNTLTNDSIHDSTYGVYLDSSPGNTLIGNSIHDDYYGIYPHSSDDTTDIGSHLYNDVASVYADGPSSDMNLSGTVFDKPAGNFTAYTNLSLHDNMDPGDYFDIGWVPDPGGVPSGGRSFESKYVQIYSSAPIDSLVWHWTDAEVVAGGYNESILGLYDTSAWAPLNTTPDVSGNTLGLSGYTPGGTIGILEYSPPPVTCPLPIDTPGYHELNQTASGAPNDASELYGGAMACVKITASDVVFDCNGFNITNDGTSDSVGIYVVSPAQNVTIRNCPMILDYFIGVLTSNYTNVTNVVVENSTGFLSVGIQLGGPYNMIANNTVGGASSWGIATAGFPLYGNQSFGNIIANNTVSDSEECIYLIVGSNDNLVSGNTVHDCTSYGIFDQVGARNTIIGNTMHNSWHGIMILGDPAIVSNSTIANNIAYDNGFSSIWFDRVTGYNVTNNTLRNSSQAGLFLISDDYGDLRDNNFINNTVYDIPGTAYGFYIQTEYPSSGYYASDNNFTGNVVHDCYNGFYFGISYGNILANNTVYANSNRGLYLYNSSASVSGDHYYDNNWDFRAEEASDHINLSSVIFDNPAGDFTNYTNLSLSDTVNDGESYSLRWSDQPGSLRPGARSFESKYLLLSNDYGSPSIDSMTWSWQESEVIAGGYNESVLGLYGYAGSWSALNTTPDTFVHTLGLSDFAPDGVVGILEYSPPPVTCPLPIDTPGYHELNQTASGAPNDASELYGGAMACVKITASDVVFDCNGFNITNDGTSDSIGIFVDGYSGPLTNVTVRNCPGIPGYNTGIYVYGASGSTFANITASGDTDGGFGLYSSSDNAITNISASSNGYSGFSLADSDNNTFENCIADNDWRAGFITFSSNNNTLENSAASNSAFSGFDIGDSSAGNTLRGNTAYNNTFQGISLAFNHDNILENNNASDNQGIGIYLQSCDNTTLRNNTANGNPWYNVQLYESNGSTIVHNTADYGSNIGIYLYASHGNNLTDNTAAENGWADFWTLVESDSDCNNLVSRMNGSGNRPVNYTNETVDWEGVTASEIFLCNADGSVIRNVTINGSDTLDNNGLVFMNTDNAIVAGSDSYANGGGFMVYSGTNNTFANDSAEGGYYGFYVEYGSGNSLINNTVANSGYGFDIDYIANGNTLANNTVYGAYTGIFLYDADANALSNEHYYGNTIDLDVVEDQGTSLSYSAAGIIFDNPPANDHTALSINDTFSNEEYQISWDSQPAALPENQTSFAQKFIRMTPISGTPSLDSVAWSWTPAEVSSGGYDESNFSVWSYDSGIWANQTTGTLDTLTHTFTIADLVPASTYGILQNGPAGPVSENVSVALESPAAGYNATARAVTFDCSANASAGLSNITLYGNFTGTWQANTTNSVGGSSNSTEFTLNLSYSSYMWNCLAYDTDGMSAWGPANYTFTADSLPRDSDFGGSTTDFSSELDLQNVSTPILENPAYGILQWNGSGLDVAGADFNSYVLFGNGTVSVDSSHLSSTLNSPANITLYGLPYQYTPVVYADGVLCTSDCTILSYVSHNLAFTVQHFTNYSAGPNTNLAIYDQYEGSNVSKLTPITFYANYTNATDNSHVAGATCTISFDDATSGTMVDTGTQYNYTKAAGFSTTGIHLWNATCNETGYETLFAQDDVNVGPLNLTGNQTSLYMANVINATALPRFVYNASGNLSSEGGNITGSNIYTEQLTDRWAAFYGNITGSIILTSKEGANNVYQWGWTPASGGVVCTSTNSSVTDLTLYPADGDDIDAAWSFAPTEADSGRNTFNQTGCSLTIGTAPITNAGYADTGQAGGFVTCSLKDTIIAAKQDMFFCTNITQNGVFWNNETGDFELMVPTAFGNNVYETYYFYVNLD